MGVKGDRMFYFSYPYLSGRLPVPPEPFLVLACRGLQRFVGPIRLADIGQRHMGTFPGQTLNHGRADATDCRR